MAAPVPSQREFAPGTDLSRVGRDQCCRDRVLDRDADGFVQRDLLGGRTPRFGARPEFRVDVLGRDQAVADRLRKIVAARRDRRQRGLIVELPACGLVADRRDVRAWRKPISANNPLARCGRAWPPPRGPWRCPSTSRCWPACCWRCFFAATSTRWRTTRTPSPRSRHKAPHAPDLEGPPRRALRRVGARDTQTTGSKPEAASAYAPRIGDLDNRTFLVTGANTGIGRETALALAGRGGRVFVASRSEQKTRPVIDEIVAQAGNPAVEFLSLDLGDLTTVRTCASEFLGTGEPLHGLINNAGLAGGRGMTDSGFELAFGTNYVGPFLLTSLLLDGLRESAPSRIVNVSSIGHYRASGIDYEAVRQRTKSLTGFPEYCVSKLGNVLHAQELARRLEGTGVTTYSLHPGEVASDVWRRVPWPLRPLIKRRMVSPAEGARTSLYCATSPDVAAESGHYYDDCRRQEPSAVATPQLAAELWDRSIDWVDMAK
jgi:retinol dehydrogenase-12